MNRLDMLEAGRAALPFQLTTAQERVLGQVGCLLAGTDIGCRAWVTHRLSCAGLMAKGRSNSC